MDMTDCTVTLDSTSFERCPV